MAIWLHFLVILLAFCLPNTVSYALECFSCSHVDNVISCSNITLCNSGQSCFMNASNTGNSLGCIDDQRCGTLPNVGNSLIGRGLMNKDGIEFQNSNYKAVRGLTARDQDQCFECCSSNICNIHLCNHPKPSSCVDDPKVDCALMNSKFNICQNIHESKTICPKFCRLCSLVDGQWAPWSERSDCDVTCANGTRTRARQCSNPAPASGGLDCPGNAKESKTCFLNNCPIDGIWEDWSLWTSCEVTCDNGTQTRSRSCNNPPPAYGGQNCSGSDSDHKPCVKDICPIHGGWTLWMAWESCSVTCDIGLQLRHRNYSNPKPQLSGNHCFGDPMEARLCQPGPCANGGWSAWSTWSDCSVSCGGGMKSRSRSCTNPRPSPFGRPCEGGELQDSSCNNVQCLTPTIVFRAKTLKNLSNTPARTLIFTNVLLNLGNGYDNRTGVFTAPVAGTYTFSTELCNNEQNNYAWVSIQQNGVEITGNFFQGAYGAPCYTADAFAVLKENDTVRVHLDDGAGMMYDYHNYRWNSFSGMLVHV